MLLSIVVLSSAMVMAMVLADESDRRVEKVSALSTFAKKEVTVRDMIEKSRRK